MTHIKVLQINIDRRNGAQDLANRMAQKNNMDIILMQEPNVTETRRDKRWIVDDCQVVATRCVNRNCGVKSLYCGRGFVKINFESWSLYNCYISPNVNRETFKAYIDGVMEDVR